MLKTGSTSLCPLTPHTFLYIHTYLIDPLHHQFHSSLPSLPYFWHSFSLNSCWIISNLSASSPLVFPWSPVLSLLVLLSSLLFRLAPHRLLLPRLHGKKEQISTNSHSSRILILKCWRVPSKICSIPIPTSPWTPPFPSENTLELLFRLTAEGKTYCVYHSSSTPSICWQSNRIPPASADGSPGFSSVDPGYIFWRALLQSALARRWRRGRRRIIGRSCLVRVSSIV